MTDITNSTHTMFRVALITRKKAEKEIMLDLIAKIVARLNEINDGSFVAQDLESERLKAL